MVTLSGDALATEVGVQAAPMRLLSEGLAVKITDIDGASRWALTELVLQELGVKAAPVA